eukprot:31333-Pelagococcus_subviridis.AAC.15
MASVEWGGEGGGQDAFAERSTRSSAGRERFLRRGKNTAARTLKTRRAMATNAAGATSRWTRRRARTLRRRARDESRRATWRRARARSSRTLGRARRRLEDLDSLVPPPRARGPDDALATRRRRRSRAGRATRRDEESRGRTPWLEFDTNVRRARV